MAPKKAATSVKKAETKKPVAEPKKSKCASGGCCGSIRKLAYFLAFAAFVCHHHTTHPMCHNTTATALFHPHSRLSNKTTPPNQHRRPRGCP